MRNIKECTRIRHIITPMHELIHFPLCPRSRSIRLLLTELGFEYELQEENPRAWNAEFLALNPSGELPVLCHAEGPVLSGVYAISEFIDEDVRGQSNDGSVGEPVQTIFPGNRVDRAEVRRLVDWFLHKMDTEVTGYLMHERVVSPLIEGGVSAPDTEAVRAARENLRYHMSYVGHLTGERKWLAGDEMSFADLIAASQLSCVDYLDEMPWEEFEDAKLWYSRVKSRPAFRPLLADRIAGIAPPPHYGDLDF